MPSTTFNRFLQEEIYKYYGNIDIVIVYAGECCEAVYSFLERIQSSSNVKVAIVHCTQKPDVICNFSTPTVAINQNLPNLSVHPYYYRALRMCSSLLALEGRRQAKRILLMITNDRFISYSSTLQVASTLFNSALLFCIGIGPRANEEQVKSLSTDGRYYIMVDSISKALVLHPPAVLISNVSYCSITLEFDTEEETQVEMLDPSNTYYMEVGCPAHKLLKVKNLEPDSKYYFRARTVWHGTFSKWSKQFMVETISNHPFTTILSDHDLLKKANSTLIDDLSTPHKYDGYYNLLVLNYEENSLGDLLFRSMSVQQKIYVTKTNLGHELSFNIYNIPKFKIRIWDLHGWTKNRTTQLLKALPYILDGNYYRDSFFSESYRFIIPEHCEADESSTLLEEYMHAIIISIDADANNFNDKELKQTKQLLIKRKYNPLFAINKMDVIDAKFSKKMYDSSKIIRFIQGITTVQADNMFLFADSGCYDDRDLLRSLNFLQHTVENASLFIEYMESQTEKTFTIPKRKKLLRDCLLAAGTLILVLSIYVL